MNPAFTTYPFSLQKYAGTVPSLNAGVDPLGHPVAIECGGPVGMTD